MSRAAHPSQAPAKCSSPPDCTAAAIARVAHPQLPTSPGLGYVIIRPISSPVAHGQLVCVDHVHVAVDLMLLRATPEPRR